MRKLAIIVFALFLTGCGADNGKTDSPKQKKAVRPVDPKIDRYTIDGFGLVELDFSITDHNAYKEAGFDKSKAANLKLSADGQVLTDSSDYFPLPLFVNGPKVYFQALAKSDGFVQVVFDELYGNELWIAPGPGQRILGWPAFLLEAKSVRPAGDGAFLAELSLDADPVYDIPDSCYRAVQSTQEWIHLMKKEDCTDKKLPKMLYLNWRDDKKRLVDFEFSEQ